MSEQIPPERTEDGTWDAAGRSEADLANPGMNPVTGGEGGPGSGRVGVVGIVLLTTYLVVFTLFLIYALIVVWPVPTPSGQPDIAKATASPSPLVIRLPLQRRHPGKRRHRLGRLRRLPLPRPSRQAQWCVKLLPQVHRLPRERLPNQHPGPSYFFGRQFKLWDEQQLILLVLLAGALGSILHSLRSVYWYIGNRSLVRSWMAMYIVLPFAGSTLALIFYLVIRGGFFSPQSKFEQTSPFGFAAFAALIGMFSPQAVLKLREVAETLLSKPQPGANAKPQEILNPGAPTNPSTPTKKP